MLPWLVTFHVARLGFEAQNAAAFRFLRLVRNASRTEADEIISDTIAPPLDSPAAAIKVAPKRRRSMNKVYKKSARANKRKTPLSKRILRLSTPLGPIADCNHHEIGRSNAQNAPR
jgi:hypothetical protein